VPTLRAVATFRRLPVAWPGAALVTILVLLGGVLEGGVLDECRDAPLSCSPSQPRPRVIAGLCFVLIARWRGSSASRDVLGAVI